MHLVMFQVLDRQPFDVVAGEIVPSGPWLPPPPEEAGWKDTVQAGPGEITRVIARFEDYTGKFAYHCHILEHEDHEMMRQFQTVECGNGVVEPGEQCDDTNREDGDCCSSSCQFEPAGSFCPGDGNVCTDDVCDGAGSCSHAYNTASCHDGSPCTVGEMCHQGVCTPRGMLSCHGADVCSPPSPEDADADGISHTCDNCPATPNFDQADLDQDGVGDACDSCPNVGNFHQSDGDGNGIGDACQCGDVTGDGFTNATDALTIARGQVGPHHPHFEKCDVNGDTLCNVTDALAIARGHVSSTHQEQHCAAYMGHLGTGHHGMRP
jgi:cysteine-rich repeat protein